LKAAYVQTLLNRPESCLSEASTLNQEHRTYREMIDLKEKPKTVKENEVFLFVGDAYEKGLNGREAVWAARKYRGHRIILENLMADMEKAKLR
jgi:hypothetical protein